MPILDKKDTSKLAEYEAFVRQSPYACAMQDTGWAKVKNNWSCEYVYLEENGKIYAAMSILGIKAAADKTFLYAPRGPVADFYDVGLVKRLVDEARPLFDKYNAFLLRMDPKVATDKELIKKYKSEGFLFRSDESDIHSFSNPRYEIMLTLKDKSLDDIFAGFNSMTKRHIRASKKAGVVTSFSRSREDMEIFFDLHVKMAARQGITYRPKDYFMRLLDAFSDLRIYKSFYDGQYIGSMLGLPYGKEMWYIYGGTATMSGKVSPGYLLIWDLICWGHELGKEYFNMGGTYSLDMEDGLFFFKHGFCKADEPKVWIGELDYVIDSKAYDSFINR